jgi:NAD(P)-dependent dehydrogenase (short-subunit alcohol dehydrogenase family)
MSVRQLMDLTGRVALVTGGSRGLGLQIAEGLGEMGARVALTARKAEELEGARAHLAKLGIEALPIPCDMQDPRAIATMVEKTIAGLGPIDILVNNAGTTWGADIVDHPLDAWLKVINLNLTAMFATTQEVGKRCMVPRKRGRVVNIASILGLIAGAERERPGTVAYNTSKGGVISFTRTVAAEWAQYGITANAIAPGFFPTKMTKGLMEILGDKAASKAPLNRVGGPEDLKGLAVLLASDASAFITGQTIAVDGGATII